MQCFYVAGTMAECLLSRDGRLWEVQGAVSRENLPFLNKTKLHTFIYLQNNIKTSRERNPPRFERGASYGLFWPILGAKMRELFR